MHVVVIISLLALMGCCLVLAEVVFVGRILRLRREARAAETFERVRPAVYDLLEDAQDIEARRRLVEIGARDWRRLELRLLTLLEQLRGDNLRDFVLALDGRDFEGQTRRDLASRRTMVRLRGAHRAGVLQLEACRADLEHAALDRDAWVADAAVRSLGIIGDPASAVVVFRAVCNGHEGLALDALVKLCRNAPQMVAANLAAESDRARRVAATVVGEVNLVTLGRDLEPLATQDPSPLVRLAAVRSLGDLGNPLHLDAVVTATHDPVLAVRRAALIALGKLGDPGALPALLAAMGDDADLPDRAAESVLDLGAQGREALSALGRTGPGPAAAALVRADLRRGRR